jgi:hypothetical protein
MTALTVPDVLRRAEQELAGHWGQGESRLARKEICAVDAIGWASLGAIGLAIRAERALICVIGEDNIADWNDEPIRTEAEVRAALLAAAQRAEAGT